MKNKIIKSFQVTFYQASITGDYRARNEDVVKTLSKPSGEHLFIVCDGMGGHPHGDFASQFTADNFEKEFTKTQFADLRKDELKSWLRRQIYKIRNRMILKMHLAEDYRDMGTVITVCLIVNQQLFWAHLGDTRLYLNRNGDVTQITQDQNVAANSKLLKKRILKETSVLAFKNIIGPMLTSSLGPHKPFNIQEGKLTICDNDTFFLSSDGLHDFMNSSDFYFHSEINATSIKNMAEQAFKNAIANGSRDNISLIIFNFKN